MASGWFLPAASRRSACLCGIDLIYLDSANRVLHLVEQLGPFRVSPVKIKCCQHSGAAFAGDLFLLYTNRR